MAIVDAPMSSRVKMSIVLRPMRSPKCPSTTAPMVRAAYATPKVAKEARRAELGSAVGKNRSGKTRAAAVP